MSQKIPEITESTKFNLITSIWIVPIIALIIAGWLAYQHFADRGPEIKIIFPQNEGLIAGQSVIKFRNVPVGKVTKIYAEEGTDGVIVVARMDSKAARPYLSEHAKFWIVKPEVGLSGVSGLDTLLSGTYINVHSKGGGKHLTDKFIGLTHAYRDDLQGSYFHLSSPTGDNVEVGTPVYFKNIRVGQVEYLYLGLKHKNIEVIVFIDKLYTEYINSDSKFWLKSTVNIDFTRGNLDVSIAPMNYLLQGGIVFSSSGKNDTSLIADDHIFKLFTNKTEAERQVIGSEVEFVKRFILLTNESIANLNLNAPVRFDGFNIGEVENIDIRYSKKAHKMTGEILLWIDTSVFKDRHDINTTGLENFYQAIEEGLRAKLTSLDPVTGMLYVDLTFNHQDSNGSIIQGTKYAQLPIASTNNVGIMDSVNQILNKLKDLPLEKLLASVTKVVDESVEPVKNANVLLLDLQTTVNNINKLTSKKSFEVLPDELSAALKETTRTLKSTEKVVRGYDSNSLIKQQLADTLQILTKTSQEMQVFLRMLNRKPNSLIFGDN
ncbi:MlaD family protein [Sulfurovum sp.]|uniref:PqiB family protein n=1 Tax=Sulfurovum sp. TaxID=1969726 RepID=UPI002867E7FB|nr:MlaD family protein [Sulfurovum sp.]